MDKCTNEHDQQAVTEINFIKTPIEKILGFNKKHWVLPVFSSTYIRLLLFNHHLPNQDQDGDSQPYNSSMLVYAYRRTKGINWNQIVKPTAH